MNCIESGGRLSGAARAVCFKCLKSNGFNLQQVNFKNPIKIGLLIAVVVFAYVLCLLEGIQQRKRIKTKHYRSGLTGPAQSFFKKGMQELSARLVDFKQFLKRVITWCNSLPKVKWHFVQ